MDTIAIPKLASRQIGLSLVELMISITIGMILLLGITSLIVQQSGTRDELEKSSRQIENGRYAMQLLHDDIEHAGFYSEYTPAAGTFNYVIPADPCAAGAGWAPGTMPMPVYGYPGPGTAADPTAASAPSCGGLANYLPGTAVLVVSRTGSNTFSITNPAPPNSNATPLGANNAGSTYFQVSQCSNTTTPYILASAGTPGALSTASYSLMQRDCLTPALLRPYMVNIYYISSCDVCAPSDNIPTLKMVQAGPAATAGVNFWVSLPIPLVEGIENMQFDYGLDNTGDGAPDTYTTAPLVTDWPNVMAIRINLLARNIDPTPGYADSKTYNMSGSNTPAPITVGPFNGPNFPLSPECGGAASFPQLCNYKRHYYSELVRVINPSGRRAN